MSELKKLFMMVFGVIVLVIVLDRAKSVAEIEKGTSTFMNDVISAVQGKAK